MLQHCLWTVLLQGVLVPIGQCCCVMQRCHAVLFRALTAAPAANKAAATLAMTSR
jgi:hypothetical protein